MELSVPKGMTDSLPEDQILLNRITSILTHVFELYGFEPLDTPAIEMREILASKYAGGEEILKEIYTFTDRGERELALRYDLTVPFARVYGMYKPPLPFKRYQIGKVWRDGPTGLGRYREFYQCDVDVIGVASMLADAEFAALASEVFRRLEIPVTIKVNNRKLLNGMVLAAGIPEDLAARAILVVDKLEKIGASGVLAELAEKGIDAAAAERLLAAANVQGTNAQVLETLATRSVNQAWEDGVRELGELTRYAEGMGVTDLQVDPSLARGLAYYTGTVYEVVAVGSSITSSITGGGRYDDMVGAFLQDGTTYPAVGISFGLSRIVDVLRERESARGSVIQVFVVPFREQVAEAIALTTYLRAAGINADFEKVTRGLKGSLKFVNARRIPYAVIIGADEVAQGRYKLRDMTTGQEELLTREALAERVQPATR
ncbi:MAG: histidine--tRNA ligase [Ktedonobacterales bacterium]